MMKINFLLADGFISDILVQWGDPLGNNQRVGSHNDYLAFFTSEK